MGKNTYWLATEEVSLGNKEKHVTWFKSVLRSNMFAKHMPQIRLEVSGDARS